MEELIEFNIEKPVLQKYITEMLHENTMKSLYKQ